MTWTQIRVTVKVEYIDRITDILTSFDPGVMIEDYSDIMTSLRTVYGELIDEKILNADKTIASASIFVSPDNNAFEIKDAIAKRIASCGIKADIATAELIEEDWSNAWKKFYKPTRIGKNIVIVPSWEKYERKPEDIVIDMDPGMAFGTGTHETTALCASLLEDNVNKGDYMLDVGSGSGILAICASKLGAGLCSACDIDPVAVRVEKENALRNKCDNIECFVSDLLSSVECRSGRPYDIVTANIVADIIIRMSPDIGRFIRSNGKLIVSGIITERECEVSGYLTNNGFSCDKTERKNGWSAILCTKK